MEKQRFSVIPVLLPGAKTHELPAELVRRQIVDLRKSEHLGDEVQHLFRAVGIDSPSKISEDDNARVRATILGRLADTLLKGGELDESLRIRKQATTCLTPEYSAKMLSYCAL